MIEILSGALAGMLAGFLVGLAVAVLSRDGIWPNVWALLILVLGLAGSIIGALDWAF